MIKLFSDVTAIYIFFQTCNHKIPNNSDFKQEVLFSHFKKEKPWHQEVHLGVVTPHTHQVSWVNHPWDNRLPSWRFGVPAGAGGDHTCLPGSKVESERKGKETPVSFKTTPLKDYPEFLHTFYWLLFDYMAPYNFNWVQDMEFLLENIKEKLEYFSVIYDPIHPYHLILKPLPK